MKSIVGNETIRNKLCSDIVADKLSHAFIIEGPRGSGKHTVAMNTAAALACRERGSGGDVPCGECPECKKIFAGNSPDVILVGCEGKATLGVESVRFLKTDIHTVPNDLDFKLYIIEDADKMTVQAQNAFLLTLEEPPSFVRFILLCESADALLETIRSRAPVLRTEPVPHDALAAYICEHDRRAAQMKLTSPADFSELVMASCHGIGRALEYLDAKAFSGAKDMRKLAYDLCEVATTGAGAREALPLLNRFSSKRDVLSSQLSVLSEAVTDLLLLKKTEHAPLEFFSDREAACTMSDRVSVQLLYGFSEAVMTAIDHNRRNANVRLTLLKMLSDAKII